MIPTKPAAKAIDSETDWWFTALSTEERAAIEEAFKPLGNMKAESLANSIDPCAVGTLASYLKKEPLRHFGYKLLTRADSLVNENVPILQLHFYFALRGDFFFRWRESDAFALEEAVRSYQKQIGVSANAVRAFKDNKLWGFIPAHTGYRQLRIIEEKRNNLTLAKAICEQAKSEGWADNWDHHITRIDKKLAKT